MPVRLFAAALASISLLSSAGQATESSLQLTITTQSGEFEQRVVRYNCASDAVIEVRYINAAPNFLALVPVADEPEPLVMAAVLSGSGASYAAGKWSWWTKGAEASLYDATLPADADPVLVCTEVNNIP